MAVALSHLHSSSLHCVALPSVLLSKADTIVFHGSLGGRSLNSIVVPLEKYSLNKIITQKRFLRPNHLIYKLGRKAVKSAAYNKFLSSEEDGDDACELVSGTEIVLGEGGDIFNAYLLKAVKNNNGTAVLLLSDQFGYHDPEIRDFAYRLSCGGYNVLVPDLFGGESWSKGVSQSESELPGNEPWPLNVERVDMCRKWLVDEFTTAGISKKLGIVGLSIGGGQLVEALAKDAQSHFGAAVCFYGTQINPTRLVQIKIPLLFIVGDVDPLCPIGQLHDAKKQLKGSEVHVYSGRGHGFAHHPKTLEEDEDAEDAFSRMKNWLNSNLLQS
eukprot:TRINITY_DN6188_c0_g1_i1.p1 TRINITY_DN6188_c0_g1~~TRINITY_DN6188_c0_g1_i1.p1  ORF type:complete len:328 (+),score=55.68 TRINITY_DN6188_c0_g1_i1:217-1200(+)